MSSEPAPDGKAPDGIRRPQLKMQFPASAALQPVRLPDGYSLATLAERDASEWIAVLNANGQLGAWDAARAERCFNDPRPVIPEGTWLIMHRGRAVATACTVLPTAAEPRHELGWVAVDPAHQGKGLGRQVCAAVLWYARRRGWPASTLNTDDWRLPAIRTYLKLGFEPEITHDSHPARWQEVHRLLATQGERK
ncbi:MAG: GNAT family N-acetyltransferase [Spirochaetaceae bacterium]|nr:GNAT family N-acetyltransferase [Spirochaetaceae bacterium]